MLYFAIFAGILLILFIFTVGYLSQKPKKSSTIPGLDPVTKEQGNIGDIAKAGSLHEFLLSLHEQFGPIASFWYGPCFTVSIASAELFKEHQAAFDRPPELFQLFEPLFGAKSITYANGDEGRSRRNHFDKCLTFNACRKYFAFYQEEANAILTKWSTMLNGEHVPVTQHMFSYAIKSSAPSLFGKDRQNDIDTLEFKKAYDVVWEELERRLAEPTTAEREATFAEGKKFIENSIRRLVKYRKENQSQHGEELLLDLIMDYSDDEEFQISECITYIVASFHTTGNTLTWALYYLGKHQDCQDKVADEIKEKLGDEEVDYNNINELVYMRQVIDETLRCAILAPTAARFQDFESTLGGHKIPKNTPVIHALGVSFKDEKVFPQHDRFDPDRFQAKKAKDRSHFAFSPFGFGGKRICPGQRFAYSNITVVMATIIRNFKITLVEGQTIRPVFGLVTHPNEEIWITLSKR